MKSTLKAGQRGFTLIELMIVVAIIGILAAVAIPKFADMLRKSKEGATKGALTNLRSALTIYVSDNEGLAPMTYSSGGAYSESALRSIISPKYIEAIPTSKLGTYHPDIETIRVTYRSDRGADIADTGVTVSTPAGETSGWSYTSSSGGGWWLNCGHTDTKNVWITNW